MKPKLYEITYLEFIKSHYYNGNFLGIVSWRIHLFLLFISIIIMKLNEYDK